MRKNLLKVVILGVVFALGHGSMGLSSSKTGTTGAAFLKIPCGARAIGMGGAFVAMSDDPYAVYWNPAGLAHSSQKKMTFTYLDYFEGMGFGYIGYVYPTGMGTFGLALSYLGHEEIPQYDFEGKRIGSYRANDMVTTLSYGRRFGREILVGGNLKWISQRIEREEGSCFAIDLGGIYRMGTVSFGAAILNLGQEIKFVKEEAPLPLNFRLGLAFKLLNEKVVFSLDGNLPNDNDPYFCAGGEYWPFELLAFRAGWRGGPKDEGRGVCGGIGMRWKGFELDFAYEPYGELGDAYYYSLGIKF
jgi:hypothetical protein